MAPVGFDSTIVLAQVVGTPLPDVPASAYPEVTIELPRWGWLWARDRHSLTTGSQVYRLMLPGEPEGVCEDSYGVPLRALDPRALEAYVKNEQSDSRSLPTVGALRGLLRALRKGHWSDEYVLLCLGH